MSFVSTTPNLAYTVAFDQEGQTFHRQMAKLLVSSLIRTKWQGDIMVFRNTPAPLFLTPRVGLTEVYIETKPKKDATEHVHDAWCWKYRVSNYIDGSKYNKVMFLDDDTMALRNLDHLLNNGADVLYQTEALNISSAQFSAFLTDYEMKHLRRRGINTGHLAVRGAIYQDVMDEWQRIDESEPPQHKGCLDQCSFNRLVLDADAGKLPWKCRHFERGEIQFPLHCDPSWKSYYNSALVHVVGAGYNEKLQFLFGLYMSKFFWDPSLALHNIIDM